MAETVAMAMNSRVRYRAVGEDGVLVHLDNAEVMVVNEVGLFLVQQLSQSRTTQQLVDAVVGEFNVEPGRASADVDSYISQLRERELILVEPVVEGI